MIEILFLVADLWMITVGLVCGVKFFRRYGNHLLGIEWLVVATSGTNFLLWSLLGGDESSPLYAIAYFFDAFSRSFGITLVLVLGLMAVTHRYKPRPAIEIGALALALVGGLYLRQFHDDGTLYVAPATFFVVTNLATSVFLIYFATRLWRAGARAVAIWTGIVTVAAMVIALTYDFFPFPFDDVNRTYFYTAALTTWGAQGLVYFLGYRALHEHNLAGGNISVDSTVPLPDHRTA
ncbi:hypothetical protein [Glutamicibacter sp. X7]